MADIRPFKGYRYRLHSPGDLGPLVSPPYDMLDQTAIDALHEASPNNVIRIIQNRPQPGDSANRDRHERAAQLFNQWIRDGKIVRDDTESFYVYRQQFSFEQGGKQIPCERIGLTACVRLVDFSEGVILPHENTLSGPKVDRYELMQATNANTELIFGLVSDDGALYREIRELLSQPLAGNFTDSRSVRHELYRMCDAGRIARLSAMFAGRTILIADGHHRYETALKYARDTGTAETAYVMMTIVSMADPGLIIWPFHRVVKKCERSRGLSSVRDLAPYFDISDLGEASIQHINNFVGGKLDCEMLFLDASSRRSFGLVTSTAGKQYLATHNGGLSAQWNDLQVSKINRFAVEAIMKQPLDGHVLHDVFDYTENASAAFEQVMSGTGYSGCFFIKPLSISAVKNIVSGGERMPQKSTNFFPKLFSGLVFNKLER